MYRRPALRLLHACRSALGITLALGAVHAEAGEAPSKDGRAVHFNSAFLPGGSAMKIDLSRYARRNPVMPGTYDADIWLNGEWQVRRSVSFAAADMQSDAVPCITRSALTSFGIVMAAEAAVGDERCVSLADRVPGATARFDVGEQRLDIEVPQAALVRHRTGAVPAAKRDEGIP